MHGRLPRRIPGEVAQLDLLPQLRPCDELHLRLAAERVGGGGDEARRQKRVVGSAARDAIVVGGGARSGGAAAAAPPRKLRRICSPTAPDFSGWNWHAARRPSATAHVKRWPP